MLLGGAKGHMAVMDWQRLSLVAEFHLRESVHDVCFLHNSQLLAAAQRKYAYIYDGSGAEVHCLRDHVEPLALEFLPYHFLLASVGTAGWLKYQVRPAFHALAAAAAPPRPVMRGCHSRGAPRRTCPRARLWRSTARSSGRAACCARTRTTRCSAAGTATVRARGAAGAGEGGGQPGV